MSPRSKALASPASTDTGVGGSAPRLMKRPAVTGSTPCRSRVGAFAVSGTIAYVVNMAQDVERRKSVRREVAVLRPLQCVIPRGFHGSRLVRTTERGPDANTCRLRLTQDGAARFGVASVLQRTKRPANAIGAFGCAMSHRAVLQTVAAQAGPGDFVWIFEDGAYCPTAPGDIVACLERLLCSALQRKHPVDIVYCGQTNAVSTGEVLACHGGCAPQRACQCPGRRLVRTKSSYGSFAYLLRRSIAHVICESLDPAAVVCTSDGALLHSYAKGPLTATHFEKSGAPYNLIAHRPPSEAGGSRIRT